MKYNFRPLTLENRGNHKFVINPLIGSALISGVGSLFSGLFGSSNTSQTNRANLEAVYATNRSNREIAEQTNLANQAIAKQTNEANIQMNKENNALQQRLQDEMNEYNSVGAQLERARLAGVNPNAVIGGSISGNLQTSLPTSQAGHSDMIPYEAGQPNIAPQLLNEAEEKINMLNAFSNIASTISQSELNKANEKKVNQETEWWTTQNKFEEEAKRLGLDLGHTQLTKLKLDCDEVAQQVENAKEVFAQLKIQTSMLSNQDKMLAIDALNHEEFVKSNLEILKTQAKYSDDMAYYTIEKIKSDIGFNESASRLNELRGKLTSEEIKLCDKNISIAEEGRKQAVYETELQNKYEEQKRWNEINNLRHEGRLMGQQTKKTREEASNLSYENTEDRRDKRSSLETVGAVSQVVGATGTAVSTYSKVSKGAKGAKNLKKTQWMNYKKRSGFTPNQ